MRPRITVVCVNDGETFSSADEAVQSVAENMINHTNETGHETFADVRASRDADGNVTYTVSDVVSTGGSGEVDTGAAIDHLGIGTTSFAYSPSIAGDVHTHPATSPSGYFSEGDVKGIERTSHNGFLVDNGGIFVWKNPRGQFERRPTARALPGVEGYAYPGARIANRTRNGGYRLVP